MRPISDGFTALSHKRHRCNVHMPLNGYMRNETLQTESLLPEWSREDDVDEAAWIAALEASRREQFAELADL